MMNSLRCSRCGNTVPQGTRYCPFCGTPITGFASPKANEKNKLLVAIIILLSVIAIGMACLLWIKMDNKPEEVEAVELWQDESKTENAATESQPTTPAVKASDAATATAQQAPVKAKVANGNYRLSGAIVYKDNYYIDMQLNVNGSRVSGQYVVTNGENVYVTLSGSIDANGNMKLTEYKGGSATGYYFTGRFNQRNYSGKYRCTYRKLTMNFNASVY